MTPRARYIRRQVYRRRVFLKHIRADDWSKVSGDEFFFYYSLFADGGLKDVAEKLSEIWAKANPKAARWSACPACGSAGMEEEDE